jgi:hypothetical protein
MFLDAHVIGYCDPDETQTPLLCDISFLDPFKLHR